MPGIALGARRPGAYRVGMIARPALRAVAVAALAASCVQTVHRTEHADLTTVDREAPFLKAHLRNGDLVVLDRWTADDRARQVSGDGERFGADRRLVERGPLTVALADVALFETNTISTSPAVGAMAVLTVASAATTVVCLTTPKACFGSCPTFYAPGDGEPVLQAEGFSDAIAPALETHDVDALWRTHVTDGHLTLRMTNEAYETHVVKAADVLAVPRPAGTRVLSTGDRLWLATALAPAATCAAAEGDCAAAVAAVDGRERTSVTDPDDLGAREVIDLTFAAGPAAERGRAGVVIGARQSLVTTFLLYQGLSYLGPGAVRWLAGLAPRRSGDDRLARALGGIEVQVPHGAGWVTVGEIYETGPIATDVHLVVLPPGERGDRVRLKLPRGGWRIDHVARAALAHEVTAQRIAPRAIRGTLGREYAAHRAPATAFPIVTLPGDAYELDYDIPTGEVELLIDSRGYYLEWMRADWLAAPDPVAALMLVVDPARALRALAPQWKRMEADAETTFWRSRYARP